MYFVFLFIVFLTLAYAAFLFIPQGYVLKPFRNENARLPFPYLSLTFVMFSLLTLVAGYAAYPHIYVWQRGMAGQAQMAEAEANRQIKVREAQAEKDAAELLGDAEVIRARGVKEANDIVANGLGGPEGYLRYLYIQGLKDANANGAAKLIYIPTEAGLPITEAGRMSKVN